METKAVENGSVDGAEQGVRSWEAGDERDVEEEATSAGAKTGSRATKAASRAI
jgi:hypothetical protein